MVASLSILRLAAVFTIVAGLTDGAGAQDKPNNWLTDLFKPPTATSVPGGAGEREWSGQAGASGDPSMTVDAIRAAAADFGNCVAGLWPDASRRGVSRANFDRFTAGLTPDLHIMDLLDAQPEFTKSPWDYLDLLVNDDRIARGRALLAQYAPTFEAVEKTYGVDRNIVAAIWGVEFELRHVGRRSLRGALDRNACLRRPPPQLFPRGILVGARDTATRRCSARASDRIVGRRVRSDAIHADVIQTLCCRLRR